MEVGLSSSSEDNTIQMWDLKSGTPLVSYKGSQSEKSSLDFLHQRIMLVAQRDKPSIYVWHWQKDQPFLKFSCSEQLRSMSVSHKGYFCAGGSASGKIYLWEVSTGDLLRVVDAHYGKINSIKFTDNDEFLVSGGEDSAVYVWSIASILKTSDSVPKAEISWSDHSLPITDIFCGFGGKKSRIVTSSLDCTCRIWDLGTKTCLSTITYPTFINCVVMDPTETVLYAGSGSGEIYVSELYQKRAEQRFTAVDTSSIYDKNSEPILIGHKKAVQSLSISFDGSLLLSGSDDGSAIVWNTTYKQLVRSFTSHKGSVNSVRIIMRPKVDLFGTDQPPLPPISAFKRYTKNKSDDNSLLETIVRVSDTSFTTDHIIPSTDLREAKRRKVENKEEKEIEKLKDELSKVTEHNTRLKQLQENLMDIVAKKLSVNF